VTTRIEAAAVAPYFDLARRAWIPCIVLWAPETGEFARTEGPVGLRTWDETQEASRFLVRSRADGGAVTAARL